MSQILKLLQKKITQYQTTKTDRLFHQISQTIAPFIRNFPKFAFHQKDEDTLSEFYLFVLPKLKKILSSYHEEKSTFATFFSKVLKNFWISFLRTQSSQKKKDLLNISSPISEETTLSKESYDEESDEFSIRIKTEIEKLNNVLQQIILKLYFFEIFSEEDLGLLRKTSQKDYTQCVIFLEKILSELCQKRKKQSLLEDRLTALQQKILLLQENLTKTTQLNELRNTYLHKYYSIRVHPSFNLIGEFLNISQNKIANTVYNFRKEIRKTVARKNF